ncbi:alpha/beta hydrolase [Colwellia sp. MB02u-10]|uniref:alpha/beta hydrolase n=1 Tax=Colwellia sp. MB02u-10 TaxID=2759828 RepID=UPI0015F7172C|nr:alpha/beta hydrolase [Colwellia sp. MB02u-10]MBA6342313.1 alpha/beta hydrolase [Colwellia sp. MB02u-10]
MRILSVLLIIMLAACSSKQDEVVVSKPVCDLAYSSYQATVTGYCQEAAADLPESLDIINKSITIKPLDEISEVFWFNKKMKYSLIKQEASAPLIFIIAGTGASYDSVKMLSLQKSFFQQGYHVISLSSPTFANFIVNSPNTRYMPGDLAHDAEYLYQVMNLVWTQVQAQDAVEALSFSLTGYSLGGAHSAFISLLDEEKQEFNFEKVLLINPPVSLYNSVSILDKYFDLGENRPAAVAMFDDIFSRFSIAYAAQRSSKFDQGSIFSLFKNVSLTEAELKLLIGASFRISSSDMIFAIDVSFNTGAITYKNHRISKLESLTHSLQRASDITFGDYFDRAMLPRAQREDASITKADLIERYSLHAIEDYLTASDKIYLVTNQDDIILQAGEVEYLQSIFTDRAKIFPRGGHCGNFDRLSFVEHLQTTFQGGLN